MRKILLIFTLCLSFSSCGVTQYFQTSHENKILEKNKSIVKEHFPTATIVEFRRFSYLFGVEIEGQKTLYVTVDTNGTIIVTDYIDIRESKNGK